MLFGIFQLPLVLVTLLAGWALARRAGWQPPGIGRTLVISEGVGHGLRSFLLGMLLATPWALSNASGGATPGDDIRAGWQSVAAAMQPGVAEEAWSRVFMIAALYMVFRRFARAQASMAAGALLGTYWFAFLHNPTDPVLTVFLGTVFALPMTYLWLRRGLEAAMGFHFCVDLARFIAAYLTSQGLWFT